MRAIRVLVHIVVAVAVAVRVLLGADVVQLVCRAALGAALDRAVARGREPDDVVGVCWEARAADVLLIAEGLHHDWVVERAWVEQGLGTVLGR